MNNTYKICFAGLGSIGKRHLKNVCAILDNRKANYSIDAYRHDLSIPLDDEISSLISMQYDDKSALPDDYDVVFITNPTYRHYETLRTFADKAKAFFIEKPVFSSADTSVDELDLKDKITYIAAPLRFLKTIQHIKDTINFEEVLSIRASSASYLPDWRPDQDYRKSYSSSQKLGGGVVHDLIHEWDYVTYLAGFPKNTFALSRKISDLEIDSEDVAVYIGEYDHMVVSIYLDYFSRIPSRELIITTKDDVIHVDLIRGQIKYLRTGQIVNLTEERNEGYLREITYFFDIIEGRCKSNNDITHALNVLKVAETNWRRI